MFPVFYNQVDCQQSADSLLIGLFSRQHLDHRKKKNINAQQMASGFVVAGVVKGYRNALLSASRIKM